MIEVYWDCIVVLDEFDGESLFPRAHLDKVTERYDHPVEFYPRNRIDLP